MLNEITYALDYISEYWVYAIYIYLFLINLLIFICYGIDKHAAIHNRSRISERTLHLMALFGGTPLAFIAQRVFHHKTIKKKFQVTFWFIVFLQVIVIICYWVFIRNR